MFTYQHSGTTGCEILAPNGTVVAWTVDVAWAGRIVGLLNEAGWLGPSECQVDRVTGTDNNLQNQSMSLELWRHHLDPTPILAEPHVPLASTLMGMAARLDAVLGLLATLSDDRPQEKDYGVTVAGMAVEFALEVSRHLGLGDDSPTPPLLNLKMAQVVVGNLRATVEFYVDEWRDGCRSEALESTASTSEGLVVDPGTYTVAHKGQSCYLGNTMAFRLIERFSTARGTFLTIAELIQDVWSGEAVSDEAVQRQISTLRTKFKAAGIEGIVFESQPGCYRLILR